MEKVVALIDKGINFPYIVLGNILLLKYVVPVAIGGNISN
jgi:hypothetical protein